jgi:quercetin dioxygenase-like cupin family protein
MKFTRRRLAVFLPAIAPTVVRAQQASTLPAGRLPSKAIKFEDMPVKISGQNKTRAILDGETHSGFPVEVHETELPAGGSPHPPHQHISEEMFLIQEGLLDVTVNGNTTRLTPGSVFYVNSNDLHGVSNPGPKANRYFVVALGAKK